MTHDIAKLVEDTAALRRDVASTQEIASAPSGAAQSTAAAATDNANRLQAVEQDVASMKAMALEQGTLFANPEGCCPWQMCQASCAQL